MIIVVHVPPLSFLICKTGLRGTDASVAPMPPGYYSSLWKALRM